MSLLKWRGLVFGFFLLTALCGGEGAKAQRVCGQSSVFKQMEAAQPAAYAALRERHRVMADGFARAGNNALARGAATNPIPVVFHILIDSIRYITMGRDTGVRRRVASQMKVLNADYNRQNPDSTRIPAPFKPLYANVAFQFGLANGTSAYTIAPGIEVKIVTSNPTYSDITTAYNAKQNTATGLPPWDNTKYLNVWVCRLTSSGAGTVLGVTLPPQFVGSSFGGHLATPDEVGVVMNYAAFGVREFPLQYFFGSFDRGRTLTHEVGHLFELYHTWGDDDNSDQAGYCPNDKVGGNIVGYDDDIFDTPPQARRTYCDYPSHNGTYCPTFPLTDKCSPASPGVMYMNYMDYTDDTAMQMFTAGQAVHMQLALLTDLPGLIQHPELSLAVADARPAVGSISLAPNPATGMVVMSMDDAAAFRGAIVVNMLGQTVAAIPRKAGQKTYPIDLSAAPRGIYFVRCAFDGGSVTQKLILE